MSVGRHPETKRPEDVVAFFEQQIADVGVDSLLVECCDLAAKSKVGVPTTLGWFVRWLENLPSPQRPRTASGDDRNRHRMGVVGTNFEGPAPWDLPDGPPKRRGGLLNLTEHFATLERAEAQQDAGTPNPETQTERNDR